MHTNVILTNKRCTHAQSNYTNTKLKAWFRRLLHHLARKRSGPILHPLDPHRGKRQLLLVYSSLLIVNSLLALLQCWLRYRCFTRKLHFILVCFITAISCNLSTISQPNIWYKPVVDVARDAQCVTQAVADRHTDGWTDSVQQ